MEPMKPMQPMKGMAPMKPIEPLPAATPWWPQDLGTPSSSGSQNEKRYAYFADAHRLVVDDAGRITTYDTGSNRINGFSQQQGSGSSLAFDTGSGALQLDRLRIVD